MAILVHICNDCGHPSFWNERGTSRCSRACACEHKNVDPEPTRLDTWRVDDPKRQPEPLYQPGTVWNGGTSGQAHLCGCQACVDAYRAEVG